MKMLGALAINHVCPRLQITQIAVTTFYSNAGRDRVEPEEKQADLQRGGALFAFCQLGPQRGRCGSRSDHLLAAMNRAMVWRRRTQRSSTPVTEPLSSTRNWIVIEPSSLTNRRSPAG